MILQAIFLDYSCHLDNDILLFLNSFRQYSKPFFGVFVYKLEVGIQTIQITNIDGVIFV